MRRGLIKELGDVFESAKQMVGGTTHPDFITDEQARIEMLRDETIALLRRGKRKARLLNKARSAQ